MNVKKLFMTAVLLFILSAVGTIYYKGVRSTQRWPWEEAQFPEGTMISLDSMVVEGEDSTGLGPLPQLDRDQVDKKVIQEFQDVLEQKNYLEEKIDEYRLKQDELKQMEDDLRRREIDLRDRETRYRQAQLMATNENLNNTAKLYENMKADMAAPLMITMPDTVLVQILRRMKERNSAKILQVIGNELVDVDRTTRINQLFKDLPAGVSTSGD